MNEGNIAAYASSMVTRKDRQKILLIWIVIFLVIGIGVIYWKLYQVQKQIVVLENDLNTFKSDTVSDLTYLKNDLSSLRTATASDINAINSDLYMLASDLSNVAAVANNANFYAHSHPYSDSRLKSDLIPIDDPLSKLLLIKGGYYTWNETAKELYDLGTDQEIGVLAQDVGGVFPELVYTDANGYKQVNYERLSAVLIEAIRQQQDQIQMLENSIIDINK